MAEHLTSGDRQLTKGKEEGFVQRWTDRLSWTRQTQPGLASVRLTRRAGAFSHFVSFADRESANARNTWKQSDGFAQRLSACRSLGDWFDGGDYDHVWRSRPRTFGPEMAGRVRPVISGGSKERAMTEGSANAKVVVRMYGPIAADYDELWAPLLRPYGLRLLDMLTLQTSRRVLDLGCGVGRLLPDIYQRAPGAHVVGSDLTEGMISRADPRFGRVVMDAMQPAFAADSFDAAVSAFMLFHVPDPQAALKSLRRVVCAGGRVAFAVWGEEASFPALDAWDEELNAAGVPPDPAAEGPPGGEELVNSPEKMRKILSGAGFEDASAEPVPWTQPWTLDGFVDMRTRMSAGKRRLDRLDPERRQQVVSIARRRIASMSTDDLVDHDVVVLASGVSPA